LKTAAIITAGGLGSRFGGALPKQFLKVHGKPVLSHVVTRFESNNLIDAIYLSVPENYLTSCLIECLNPFEFKKIKDVVRGGKERADSVFNCLKVVDDTYDLVLIHDAVRIFVTDKMIAESIEAANLFGASVCAIPLKDTIKKVNSELFVSNTLNRDNIYCIQTPQTFERKLIVESYEQAGNQKVQFTDDASIVEEFGKTRKVKIVSGSVFNFKITTMEDLELAEFFLKAGF
jgi:2-C-methyl-D-erythritol 4-phosphate cytidylyltransferase